MRYGCVKKNAIICKICVPQSDKTVNAQHFYGLPLDLRGKRQDMELRRLLPKVPQFLPNAPQFGESAAFSWQKAPQSLDCSALQDGTLRCGAGSAGIRNCSAFCAKRATIFAKCAAIRRKRRIFTAKSTTIQGLQRFTRRRTATRPSKCDAHGGRTGAWHFLPNAPQFLPNVPQFGKRAAFSWQKAPQSLDCSALQDAKRAAIRQTRRIFTAKSTTILGLQRFTRRRTAVRPSKCDAHGGRKPAHGTFCQTHHNFCQTRRNSANTLHFHGKKHHNPWIAALYGALRRCHQSTAHTVG